MSDVSRVGERDRAVGAAPRRTPLRTPRVVRPSRATVTGRAVAELGRYGVLALALLLVVLFSALKPDTFATFDNYRRILNGQTIVVLLALGSMLPLIVGELDLSVGSVLTMSQIFAVGFVARAQLPPAVAILLAVAFALAAGAVNAVLIVRFRVHAFVATLAVGSLCQGVGLWYTHAETLFQNIPASFTDIARGQPFGVPLPVLYTAVLAVLLWFVLSYLPLGRRLYATGGNRRASLLAGIAVNRYLTGVFLVSALFAGLAGALQGAQLGSAASGGGETLLLPAIAGGFLGVTTIRPGQFNVWGTVVAVYALNITVSGLQQLGAPTWVQPVFNGAVLAVAVALSGYAFRIREIRSRNRRLMLLEQEPGEGREPPLRGGD